MERNELDIVAELHLFIFQARRGQDLAFHQHLLRQSLKSPVFRSHTEALMRAVVNDLIQGHFELESFRSRVDLGKFNEPQGRKEPKGGLYDPRHARRLINEDNVDMFFNLEPDKTDGRIKRLSSTFNPDSPLPEGISDLARYLMENEKMEFYHNLDIYSGIAFSQYLLCEYWDLFKIEEEIFERNVASAVGDEEIRKELKSWPESKDRLLNTLINHIVSMETIAGFMRRPSRTREEILRGRYRLSLSYDQLKCGMNNIMSYYGEGGTELCLHALKSVLRKGDIESAIAGMKYLSGISLGDQKIQILVALSSTQRDSGKYADMLESIGEAHSLLADSSPVIVKGLVKCRLAEALHFNGRDAEVDSLLSEIYGLALSAEDYYSGERDLVESIKVASMMESLGSQIEVKGTPVKLSLFENLIMACKRIDDCDAEIHFIREAFKGCERILTEERYLSDSSFLDSELMSATGRCSGRRRPGRWAKEK